MVRLIRALPLATLGCMLVTTVVPISGMGGDSEALRVTSLGMSVRELDDLALPYVIVWAAVVALAVLSAGAAALALAGVLGLPRRQRPVPVNP